MQLLLPESTQSYVYDWYMDEMDIDGELYPMSKTYSFDLGPEFYNPLPLEIKKFLMHRDPLGGSLYLWMRKRERFNLLEDDFYQFNLLMFNEIGHA